MKRRVLAMCLTLCMLLGMLPVVAFAATAGWSPDYGSTAITSTGTYTVTMSGMDWTSVYFKAVNADDYTFKVNSGTICYCSPASYMAMAPNATYSTGATDTYVRTMKANSSVQVSIQSTEPSVVLTITRAGENSGSSPEYTNWTNLHTPSADLVAAPVNPTLLTNLSQHSAHKVSDSEYRLDSTDGKQLYVNLRYNNKFDFTTIFGSSGFLSLRGSYNNTNYDFLTAMKAYNDVMADKEFVMESFGGAETVTKGLYWYPLTTDIMAFLQGYGSKNGDGKWYDLSADPNAWMFCLYTEADSSESTDPSEPEVTEPEVTVPSEPEVTEPEVTEPSEPTVVEKAFDDVYNDSNPITATGTYDVTLLDNTTWTMFLFNAPEIGDYTISVDKGDCGYAGAGSFYTMVPSKPATSFDRESTSVGQSMVIAIRGEDPNVQLTISKADVHYENLHTPDASLAGMPASAEAVDLTATNTVVKVTDGEYRLNTENGPILYVDLNNETIGFADILAGADAYGKVDGVTYNFKNALQAYGTAMDSSTAYPLTTDLMTFLKAYGEEQGWYADSTAADPWMFCVYADLGSGEIVEVSTIATVTNQAVTASVPHTVTWTAAEDGTLNIDATPAYAVNTQYTAFKVIMYANAGEENSIFESSILVPGDPYFPAETTFTIETGQYVVIELYAMKNYEDCDGSVNATVTFVPYVAENNEREEIAWGDLYDDTNPITAAGTYELTLKENAMWTMYQFTPTETGIYTISVDGGNLCGYAGAGSFYTFVPNTPAASFEQEVKTEGNSVVFAVTGDSNAFQVTIEKTGESQGEQEIQYADWENTHTPDPTLVGQPENAAAVDITIEHTAVKVSDGEYRLDSASGPVLYVNLSNSAFSFGDFFGAYGALTLRSTYDGVNYDFKTALSAYNDVLNGNYWYPLTTDLMVFLQAFGESQGWYAQGTSSIQSVILGTAKTPWMFCLYSAEAVVDPEEPDPTEPTEPTEPEPPVEPDTMPSAVNQPVDSGVPYIITWAATGKGTLHVDATPSYAKDVQYTSFEVDIYENEAAYTASGKPVSDGNSQTPGDRWGCKTDYPVETGQYVVVRLSAKKNYVNCAGNVNATLSFTPDGGAQVEQAEWAWDDVYHATNPITSTGTHTVTLVENATWTMFNFVPTEIGVYTITVSNGVCGYAGGVVSYVNPPSASGASFEREVKAVGNAVIFGIQSDDPNVTVTIEKTGESQGNVQAEYVPWENVHTPSADMTVPGGLEEVDITKPHTIVKISDTEYRLDSATGPILYVDLEGTRNDGWSMSLSFPAANTIRAEYEGKYYNFRAPLQEYSGYYETDENGDRVKDENGNDIYHEPQNYGMGAYYDVMKTQSYQYRLTTDLLAFIKGWGGAQGWTIPSMSPFQAVADGTADPNSAWMVVCLADPNSVIEEPQEPVLIESAALTLGSVLGVNFKVNAPEGYVLKVSVGDGEEVAISGTNSIYTVNVMAQDMMKTITAKLYDAQGNLAEEKIFELSTYVASINEMEVPAETKALANASLAYCQYAAKAKGNYSGELAALKQIPEAAFDNYVFPLGGPAGVSIHCYLEESCQLRMRLDARYAEGYTVQIDGVTVEAAQIGSTYVYATDPMLAQNYGQEYTFTILKDGSQVYSGTFSVLAYLGACLKYNVGTADMQNLLTSMYHYYAAAAVYEAANAG